MLFRWGLEKKKKDRGFLSDKSTWNRCYSAPRTNILIYRRDKTPFLIKIFTPLSIFSLKKTPLPNNYQKKYWSSVAGTFLPIFFLFSWNFFPCVRLFFKYGKNLSKTIMYIHIERCNGSCSLCSGWWQNSVLWNTRRQSASVEFRSKKLIIILTIKDFLS